MRRLAVPDPGVILLGGGVAALCALAPFLILAGVAKPAGFDARLLAATAQADRAQALAATPGDPSAYRRGALCDQPVEIAAPALRQRVAGAAKAVGVSAPTIRAVPHSLDFAHNTPSVDLQIDAVGRYDAVVQMLSRLAAEQPAIFIDTLDLQTRVSAVSLKLNGHVFCRTPARS